MATTRSVTAENVRRALAEHNVSASGLARSLGWSRRTTHRRLHGEQPFTVDELQDLATHLGIAPAELMPPLRSKTPARGS